MGYVEACASRAGFVHPCDGLILWAHSVTVASMFHHGETTYAMGWLKEGPNYVLEDSGEGNILRSTIERDTTATQVRGSRMEIKPLLLHYYLYIWIDGGTTMEVSKLTVRGGI
jgi:hypothetical protein